MDSLALPLRSRFAGYAGRLVVRFSLWPFRVKATRVWVRRSPAALGTPAMAARAVSEARATNIGFVALLPTYQRVPACLHAIDGSCCGGNCPCPAHCPPEGRRGEGLPREEIDGYWDRRADLCLSPSWSAR